MGQKKILVVDDIFINRILLTEILMDLNMPYEEASNGEEAIDRLKADSSIFLVLMDIEMPVMNGFEATTHIREKFSEPLRSIPVVAITAHDPNTFAGEFEGAGFNDMITKPYTMLKIERMLRKYQK